MKGKSALNTTERLVKGCNWASANERSSIQTWAADNVPYITKFEKM